MSHPTDGDLRAFLDGEASTKDTGTVREHLNACAACRARRDDLLDAEAVVRDALDGMTSEPDVAAARRAVRRRLEWPASTSGVRDGAAGGKPTTVESGNGSRQRSRRAWSDPGALARAAMLVLALAGGAAAALPGSPIRQWLGDLWSPQSATETTAPATEPAEVDGGGEGAAELRVAPEDGAVRIELTGAEPGTPVRIILVELESAGVVADAGVRFRSGPGRIQVSGARNEVRVEIPRTAREARVTANGQLLFRKEGGTLTLPSADPDTTGADLLFRVPPEG